MQKAKQIKNNTLRAQACPKNNKRKNRTKQENQKQTTTRTNYTIRAWAQVTSHHPRNRTCLLVPYATNQNQT